MLAAFVQGVAIGVGACYAVLTYWVEPEVTAVLIKPVIEVTMAAPLSQELLMREDYLPILEQATANARKGVPVWVKDKKDKRSVSERAVAQNR